MNDWRWQLQTDWFWWTTAAAVLAINYKQYTVSVFTNLMFVWMDNFREEWVEEKCHYVCLFVGTTLENRPRNCSRYQKSWRSDTRSESPMRSLKFAISNIMLLLILIMSLVYINMRTLLMKSKSISASLKPCFS